MDLKLPLEDSPYKLDEHGPVFILGCPRSGTTFLSRCVGAVDGVEEFVGVLWPPRLMHLLGSMPADDPLREQWLLAARDILWLSLVRRRDHRDQRAAQLYARNIGVREFLSKLTIDGALLCYKEPFLCFAAEPVAEHFPNAKFIHIIRDGRDTADSMERCYPDALTDEVLKSDDLSRNKNAEIGVWRKWNEFNIPWWVPEGDDESFATTSRYERCVWMWREMTSRARSLASLGPDRYFEIRYEDFVTDPVTHGGRIVQFLGAKETPRTKARLRRAFKTSISISEQRQPTEKLRKAQAIAGDLLTELGYA